MHPQSHVNIPISQSAHIVILCISIYESIKNSIVTCEGATLVGRKSSNLIHPLINILGWISVPQRPPHGTVALEIGPEPDLPHLAAPPYTTLSLGIHKLVPHRVSQSVPEPIQGHSRRFHFHLLLARSSQALLPLIKLVKCESYFYILSMSTSSNDTRF